MGQGKPALIESPDGDITISQGMPNDYGYTWGTKPDEDTPDDDATPVDLSDGWDARAQIRKKPGAAVWLEITTVADADGSLITLSALGEVVVHIAPASTEGEEWNASSRKEGVWDLELFKPLDPQAGVRLVMGVVTLSPDVTRAVTS